MLKLSFKKKKNKQTNKQKKTDKNAEHDDFKTTQNQHMTKNRKCSLLFIFYVYIYISFTLYLYLISLVPLTREFEYPIVEIRLTLLALTKRSRKLTQVENFH